MKEKLKILTIINPISGHGKNIDIAKVIPDILNGDVYDISIAYTEYPGHATELARRAITENYYGVIAIGGDGTVNEVAAALVNSDVALGIVPRGSGNGLALHIGIPLDINNALGIINENNIESFDYCSVNERPFFCTCGVGFDAVVSERFAESKHRGPITYLKNSIAEYFRYKCENYSIAIDGCSFTEKAFVIACCNASQYGNNAYIAPNASMHDGQLDVTIIHPFTPLDTPILGLLLFTKHIDIDTNIQCLRTSNIIITRSEPGIMHIDGEPIMMDRTLNIKCHKDGLRIFAPADTKEGKFRLPPIENNFREFVNNIKNELKI